MSEARRTTFQELNIGEMFHFDAGIETGLLCRIGEPGRTVYVKTSARKYQCPPDPREGQVGSSRVTVWRTA